MLIKNTLRKIIIKEWLILKWPITHGFYFPLRDSNLHLPNSLFSWTIYCKSMIFFYFQLSFWLIETELRWCVRGLWRAGSNFWRKIRFAKKKSISWLVWVELLLFSSENGHPPQNDVLKQQLVRSLLPHSQRALLRGSPVSLLVTE